MPHADIVRLGGRFPNRSRTVVHGGLVRTLATCGTKVQAAGDPPRRMTIETALDRQDLVELVCLAALPER